MATNLSSIDSTAASSFEMAEPDFSNTATEIDNPGELPPPPPPPVESALEDDFFDKEVQDFGQSTSEEESSTDNVITEPGEDKTNELEGAETSASEISIEVSRKDHKFKLDPTDATLRRTLRNGVKAPKLKAELDKVKEELTKFQAPEVQDKIKVWDELKEFAAQGDYDRVLQAILGEGYTSFLDKKLSERLEYEEADPARRAEMDAARREREYQYKDRQRDKQIQEMQREAQERRDLATLDKWEGYAIPAIEKFGFTEDLVSDPDRRYKLNQKLWKLSWDDIEESVDNFDSVTPALVAKVFKKNAQLMKYSSNTAAKAQVEQITAQKKTEAAKTAASIATSKYPNSPVNGGDMANRVDAWIKQTGGKSAKDLLKFFK